MNKKNLRQNGEKGITLIALVITIIVMLILVGVTISMAVNGGLFEYAGKAVGDTNNVLKAEGQLAEGGVKVGGVWYNSIDEYLIATGNKENTDGDDAPSTGGDNTGSGTGTGTGTGSGTGTTASTVASNLTTYLGKTVDYGATYTDASSYGNGEWEIFYADGNNIYLITKGHLASAALTTTGYNGTSDFTADSLASKYQAVAAGLLNKTYDPTAAGTEEDPYLKYTSTNTNMKATQYLLDSTVWATYANDYAEWAIGGPTFELFVNSYNAYYPDKAVTLETPTGDGYANPLSATSSVPSGTYLNRSTTTGYWLACPASDSINYLRVVSGYVANVLMGRYDDPYAFRPVICLDSGVQLTWDETTSMYTLSRVSQ